MPRSRFTTFVILAAIAIGSVLILSSSSRHLASDAVDVVSQQPALLQAKISSIDIVPTRFTWHRSGHKPPVQKNSTSGDASWFSDWRWMNPFSSSITLDENRSVLPPLPERPFIYTYYDTSEKKDKATKAVDDQILLTWRRAWWAQGFRPVILTQLDAMSNPLYRTLGTRNIPKALHYEFSRWLAWGHMGTGLLADYQCFPMAAHDDHLLAHLRRNQFERLTRFDGLGSGLFAGEKAQIDEAVQSVLDNITPETQKGVLEVMKSTLFKVEQPTALAYYDAEMLTKKFPAISDLILLNPNQGRTELNKMIISHLQIIWQNTFSHGIEVLKPLPAHTTALVEPSLHLAMLLAECAESLLPASCPPNRPKCSPCVSSMMSISQPAAFKNSSSMYTIATVPHPFTMITLNNASEEITVRHIRRHTDRDPWITSATRDVLGRGRGAASRVVALKDAVASNFGRSRSLWFTVEQFPAELNALPDPQKVPSNEVEQGPRRQAPFPENWLEDIDWHFGFPIPRMTKSHGESMNPVPLHDRWQKGQTGRPADKKTSYDPPPPTYEQQVIETKLLRKSRELIQSKDKNLELMRDAAEKWNLADLEAWRFVRAYQARSVMERKVFEEEEAAYTSAGTGRKSRWWQ